MAGPLTYLDHAASTPMRPEAIEAMAASMRESWANPSGSHRLAREARRAVDDARDAVAAALGCGPGEVVFTSGGTESDNLAIAGVLATRRGEAICSAIEHHAVLDPVVHAGGRLAGVDRTGTIDLGALSAALAHAASDHPKLDLPVSVVSVMAANNESGVVQPIDAVAALVRMKTPKAVLHTDAVQAVPWVDVATLTATADLVTISAHKFGGPKGVGALIVREGTRVSPLLLGGGQERDLRSGTQNVAGIVGLAAALTACTADREAVVARVGAMRDRLADGLLASITGVTESGVTGVAPDRSHKVAGACHLCIEGVEAEALLFLLDQDGICASAASSCASGAADPSHVLAAMGVPRSLAGGSLRLSLGWTTTDADVDRALVAIPAAVRRLRLADDGARRSDGASPLGFTRRPAATGSG